MLCQVYVIFLCSLKEFLSLTFWFNWYCTLSYVEHNTLTRHHGNIKETANVTVMCGMFQFLIAHNFACCLASVVSLGGFVHGIWKSGSLYSRQTSDSLTWFFTLYWMTKVRRV